MHAVGPPIPVSAPLPLVPFVPFRQRHKRGPPLPWCGAAPALLAAFPFRYSGVPLPFLSPGDVPPRLESVPGSSAAWLFQIAQSQRSSSGPAWFPPLAGHEPTPEHQTLPQSAPDESAARFFPSRALPGLPYARRSRSAASRVAARQPYGALRPRLPGAVSRDLPVPAHLWTWPAALLLRSASVLVSAPPFPRLLSPWPAVATVAVASRLLPGAQSAHPPTSASK